MHDNDPGIYEWVKLNIFSFFLSLRSLCFKNNRRVIFSFLQLIFFNFKNDISIFLAKKKCPQPKNWLIISIKLYKNCW